MKNVKNFLVTTLIVLTGLFTFFGLLFDHVLFHQHTAYAQIPCNSVGKTYTIFVKNDTFTPNLLHVNRCDKVIFTNIDVHALYLPAFGEHPKHIELPGFTEKVLGYNQSNSLIFYNTGEFAFHDHLKDNAEGELIVK